MTAPEGAMKCHEWGDATMGILEDMLDRLTAIENAINEQRDAEPRYLTKTEAAEYLGMSTTTIYRLVQAGRLRRVYLSQTMKRFDKRDLDAYMEANKTT